MRRLKRRPVLTRLQTYVSATAGSLDLRGIFSSTRQRSISNHSTVAASSSRDSSLGKLLRTRFLSRSSFTCLQVRCAILDERSVGFRLRFTSEKEGTTYKATKILRRPGSTTVVMTRRLGVCMAGGDEGLTMIVCQRSRFCSELLSSYVDKAGVDLGLLILPWAMRMHIASFSLPSHWKAERTFPGNISASPYPPV
jgi:hypothetical protein